MAESEFNALSDSHSFAAHENTLLVATINPQETARNKRVQLKPIRSGNAGETLRKSQKDLQQSPAIRQIVFIKPLPDFSHRTSYFMPLGISATDFKAISEILRIPRLYLPLLQRATPASHHVASMNSQGLILQSKPAWSHHFSLVMTKDLNTQILRMLIIGLSQVEIDSLLEAVKEPEFPGEPTIGIALYLLERRAEETQSGTSTCWKNMIGVERELGIYNKLVYQGKPAEATQHTSGGSNRDVDHLRTITKMLTSISSEVAKSEYNSELYLRMLDTLGEAAFLEGGRLHGNQEKARNHFDEYTATKIASVRSAFQSIVSESQYYAKRTQSYRETLYSLIAQTDNEIMKRIAKHTQRDSSNMLFISLVTFVLLPLTSTATFFSTSFFNFQAAPGERIVSKWLWIFFVVYIALSIPIIFFWAWRSVRQRAINEVKKVSPRTRNHAAELGITGDDAT